MSDKQPHVCPIHSTPLKYSKVEKIWYCSACLQNAYQSWIAQQEAVKRYRESAKGKESQERYEKSDKGVTARQKYLKSEKYKQRRREYNQRLKESLAIARAAKLERPSIEKDVERIRTEELSVLVQDIQEFKNVMGKNPTVAEVREWASDVYKTPISTERAKVLIETALKQKG